jgi:peroxiredoxin
VELRNAFREGGLLDDVVILYVVADNQMTPKTSQFLESQGLEDQVRLVVDPNSAAIDRLGLRRENAEAMETGVPHPATYVLDREGVVRFVDVREDFHFWLDPQLTLQALAEIP